MKLPTFLPRHKLNVARVLRLLCLVVFCLGLYKGVSFVAPLQFGDPRGAIGSRMGDDAMANYDVALWLYRAERYLLANDYAKAAYNALQNERGELSGDDQLRASQIQFLTGLIAEGAGQFREAVDAYKQALRLDPTNKYAKYNLERLLQPSGGAGGGPGKVPAGGSGRDVKKGI